MEDFLIGQLLTYLIMTCNGIITYAVRLRVLVTVRLPYKGYTATCRLTFTVFANQHEEGRNKVEYKFMIYDG